jgi:hypothetical protein
VKLDKELDRQSAASHLSKSDLAREALRRYLRVGGLPAYSRRDGPTPTIGTGQVDACRSGMTSGRCAPREDLNTWFSRFVEQE